MKQATPALRKKLSKILPLLGSDKDGEVLAAAKAIVGALKGDGFDLHDLACSLNASRETAKPIASGAFSVTPDFDNLSHFELRAWLEALARVDWLTSLERETVQDVNNRVKGGIDFCLHWRKKRCINELLARASAMGVRA